MTPKKKKSFLFFIKNITKPKLLYFLFVFLCCDRAKLWNVLIKLAVWTIICCTRSRTSWLRCWACNYKMCWNNAFSSWLAWNFGIWLLCFFCYCCVSHHCFLVDFIAKKTTSWCVKCWTNKRTNRRTKQLQWQTLSLPMKLNQALNWLSFWK